MYVCVCVGGVSVGVGVGGCGWVCFSVDHLPLSSTWLCRYDEEFQRVYLETMRRKVLQGISLPVDVRQPHSCHLSI